MSARAIREYHGKRILSRWIAEFSNNVHQTDDRVVLIGPDDFDASKAKNLQHVANLHPWLLDTPLVVKPDQLIKRRGKLGLLSINKTWPEVVSWIESRMGQQIQVDGVTGCLNHFIIEPFVAHSASDEYYICIQAQREYDEVYFYHEGGVDVGDVDAKALKLRINVHENISAALVTDSLLTHVPAGRRVRVASFVVSLFQVYRDLNFVYLEINPLVVLGDAGERIVPLDLAAKIDETAEFINSAQWGQIEFPAPFGRDELPEEAHIRHMDSQSGSSLKLTILNPNGRIWTMVAGGGASVVYSDVICDLDFAHELANYGEYSGAPTEQETFEYARTILSLICKGAKRTDGKVLLIGGGIANFTDVADTFKGIIRALKHYVDELKEQGVVIWVRRAGPNYQEGLRRMRDVGQELGLRVHVYGPETHMTAIVPLSLGLYDVNDYPEFDQVQPTIHASGSKTKTTSGGKGKVEVNDDDGESSSSLAGGSHEMKSQQSFANLSSLLVAESSGHSVINFTRSSRAIIYGLQSRAVQGMLDFDKMCGRSKPSVACMIFPFSGNHYVKFYWGTGETLIPVYTSFEEAVEKHKDASILVNFASFRSVFSTTQEALRFDQIRTIAIIAEGVPESQTRLLIHTARERGVGIIGPATVGGIKPGSFRIGNTGGMLDNIVMSKLYRPGSVAYVSRSGGMSNEINNIVARNSDGVAEGVAIGGDRYPGSRFIDHLLRYQDCPEVKMMVLLGEVGGTDEYDVCDAMRSGRLTKPLVAWCIGTCAGKFMTEVQFGHAGSLARGLLETAMAKNQAMRDAGAIVPDNFDRFGQAIRDTFVSLVQSGRLVPIQEPPVPLIPMDYDWAKRLGIVRKPANFISSISDDRGDELQYAGMPISEVFANDVGVGGVLSLLWFCRRLPDYCTKFIEMILMVTADHGPAVSGAHNTIVATRAGKDLMSSLCSGLLTIGPRFGGALDDAALQFTRACDAGQSPADFVKSKRESNELIMGIGHRIKSLSNPDRRVEIIKAYAKEHFKATAVLDYALEVEQITTRKRATLILNVDGCIAVSFVDMLRSCGAFNREEADELIRNGCLNGLFVLGRSIGFIGHFLDQRRLKQELYRHPWDDISYITQDASSF